MLDLVIAGGTCVLPSGTTAADIGIAPGIILGRLQSEKRIAPHKLNGLKVRYAWKTSGGAENR